MRGLLCYIHIFLDTHRNSVWMDHTDIQIGSEAGIMGFEIFEAEATTVSSITVAS